jgi:hypothetical protein
MWPKTLRDFALREDCFSAIFKGRSSWLQSILFRPAARTIIPLAGVHRRAGPSQRVAVIPWHPPRGVGSQFPMVPQ